MNYFSHPERFVRLLYRINHEGREFSELDSDIVKGFSFLSA
jgi:hypothetical protein